MNRNNDLLRRGVIAIVEALGNAAKLDVSENIAELNVGFNEQDERFAALETRLDQLEAQQPIAKA